MLQHDQLNILMKIFLGGDDEGPEVGTSSPCTRISGRVREAVTETMGTPRFIHVLS